MSITFFSKAKLPTRFGDFEVHLFQESNGKEHLVLAKGKLDRNNAVNVRVHSKCLTGDTFASLRCDCRDQFELSLAYIAKYDGVLIYLDQEGRGIGLSNKIKAYALQDNGLDTVEANRQLGFEDDQRNFKVAADILHYFGLKRIKLITNNPKKMVGLEDNGIKVERIPLIIKPNKHNKKYMETKKKKLNHILD